MLTVPGSKKVGYAELRKREVHKKKNIQKRLETRKRIEGAGTEEIEPISHAEKRDFQVKRSDNRI